MVTVEKAVDEVAKQHTFSQVIIVIAFHIFHPKVLFFIVVSLIYGLLLLIPFLDSLKHGKESVIVPKLRVLFHMPKRANRQFRGRDKDSLGTRSSAGFDCPLR
jgi:hypothetical protein